MPESIPYQAANDFAKKYECRQVVILAWDGDRTHVLTGGQWTSDRIAAAAEGNRLKDGMGWPENLRAASAREKELLDRIAQLESMISKP